MLEEYASVWDLEVEHAKAMIMLREIRAFLDEDHTAFMTPAYTAAFHDLREGILDILNGVNDIY